MKAKPILEPEGVDLVIEGGEFSASDLRKLRALIRKSQDEMATKKTLTAKRTSATGHTTKRTKA